MKRLLAILAALLLAAAPAAAGDRLQYSTSVAGIPLGKLKIFLEGEAPEYRVGISFGMVPLLRRIFHGDANADVSGALVGGRYVPREAVFRYKGRDGGRHRAIVFDERGIPVDLRADPPIRPTDYRMSLDEAAGAVDPATAAAMLMAPRERPCALSFDVFDGTKRHRISLVGETGRNGGVVACAGRYERIAGFKDKYMTPERRAWPFRAILADRGGRWLPLEITADTKFGPASATLRR